MTNFLSRQMDNVSAFCWQSEIFVPVYEWDNGQKTENIKKGPSGGELYQAYDVPCDIDGLKTNVKLQLEGGPVEVPAGTILQPVDGCEVRVRAVPGKSPNFPQLDITVYSAQWETVTGDFSDFFLGGEK